MTQSEQRLVSALRLLIQRVENRRDKGDWILSGDDGKALVYAKDVVDEVNITCSACIPMTHDEAERMVGG